MVGGILKNKKNKEYVYLVGERGLEGESVLHVCKSYNAAYIKWDEIRNALIDFFEGLYEATGLDKFSQALSELNCENPEEMSNFPYLEPFINKVKVHEN